MSMKSIKYILFAVCVVLPLTVSLWAQDKPKEAVKDDVTIENPVKTKPECLKAGNLLMIKHGGGSPSINFVFIPGISDPFSWQTGIG